MRWLRPRPLDEDGAVAPFVAVLATVLILMAAFAVDLGMQRVARRDMQALADVISLDLVRALEGRTVSEVTSASSPSFQDLAEAARDRNEGSLGDEPAISYRLGELDATGAFVELTGSGDVPTAVEVTAGTAVDFAFTSGSGSVSRSAVAEGVPNACFSTASFAARANLNDSFWLGPLLDVLGTEVSLDLADLQGLASADISLLGLVGTDLVAGGYDELLTTEVSLAGFILAVADVLEAESGETAEVLLLESLVTAGIGGLTLQLGEILDLGTGAASALDATVNVLDLVSTGIFVANGDSIIDVPDLNIGVPGVTNLTGAVTLGQRPTIACGRAGEVTAETSQLEVSLAGQLLEINLGVARISAPIEVSLRLNPAVAQVTELECPDPDRVLDFLVSSGLVELDVWIGSTEDDGQLLVEVPRLEGGWRSVAEGFVHAGGDTPAASTNEDGTITVTDGDYAGSTPLTTGTGSGLPTLAVSSGLELLSGTGIGELVSTLLGGLVNGVVSPLVSLVINPLVAALDSVLLTPLLESLGINLAGADVRAIPSADCGFPKLVG